jgi:hypothetical protein
VHNPYNELGLDIKTLQDAETARKVPAVLIDITMKVICLPANINCFVQLEFTRFEFSSVVNLRVALLLVTSCGLLDTDHCFREMPCLHH